MLQAFSSEVDTGSREENASNKNPGGAPVISHDRTGFPAKQIRSAMAAHRAPDEASLRVIEPAPPLNACSSRL
jgi:hypothetical protein